MGLARRKSEWSRACPGPVPGLPRDSANNKAGKGKRREGKEGRKGRKEEGKERACGAERSGPAAGADGIGSKRREQEIERWEGGRAAEQSKSEEGMQRKSRMDSSGCSLFY
jgi:hypothetical protein